MRHKPQTRSKILNADHGVDFVGDVHGCFDEFMELLRLLGYERGSDGTYRHPQGRKLLSLGDITSRGPASIKMLQFFIRHIASGAAEMVDSNHGWKIARWLDGRPVTLAHGDEKVDEEFRRFQQEFGPKKTSLLKEQSRRLLFSSPSHMMVRQNDKLVAVAVHAGIRDDYIGMESPAVHTFCRYGDVAGTGPDGRPIRKDWAKERKLKEPLIVWGHDPRPQPERLNGTLNIDQGCVFGGMLTAYRFPEDELVSVPARKNYSGLQDTPLTRYGTE
ncbi:MULTISPECIES: metallophosphoesterase [Brevibacillus]|uniref:Biotin transporter BioY n=1 Tax=Brevibacillus invocatus TaxID=173959 RepID=A0A3M8CF64_9BACL|nr:MULTISPECIES: metallophosphoesterase [Brevibacillus]MCM3080354.1 metallophosphoesterase [Brevibacillus invocatus]MCM3430565.1 metallophosphoesterase [Brevibacillus invocatus]MDH4616450.1 metallophosphoesterase [Brevibacillus sp. AY1]RNB74376.1 biotin transporter BioY [Brevibacillus invocatus]